MSAAILSQIVGNLFTRGIVYGRGMKRTTIAFALLTAFVLTGYWLWQPQESALLPPTIPQPTLEARTPHPCRPSHEMLSANAARSRTEPIRRSSAAQELHPA